MSHGQPDFGMYSLAQTIYKLTDMGELAARLGSIDTFDRRGDVIWLDDFEDNINKWLQLTLGTGASIALSNEAARNGGYSAKLVTGNAIDNYAYILKRLPYPVIGAFGFEISNNLASTDIDIEIRLDLNTGSRLKQAVFWWSDSDKKVYIQTDTVNKLEVAAGVDLWVAVSLFHTFKLIADFDRMIYKRIIINNISLDLSSYSLRDVANSTSPRLNASLWFHTLTAANKTIYTDDAIITQNEP